MKKSGIEEMPRRKPAAKNEGEIEGGGVEEK